MGKKIISEEKGKVLQFPVSQRKTDQELCQENEKQTQKTHILAGISLAFVLVGTAVLNSNVGSEKQANSRSGRTIASLSKTSEQRLENLRWEHDIAKKVSQDSGRKIASIGRKPNLKESLQFGALEGKYAISYEKNKIKKIHFNEDLGIERPKYVENRQVFMEKYKSLLPIAFSHARLKDDLITDDQIQETYELRNQEEKVGEVEFHLDSHGRLLSMTVK